MNVEGMKLCGKCGELKSNDHFHTMRASPDGLAYKCKVCVNDYSKSWRMRNPDAHKNWYAENKERKRRYWVSWREKNKVKQAASYKKWVTKNKHKKNSLIAKRTALRKRALASWINTDAVMRIYGEAIRMTEDTGIPHEVDHIIPLQGKLVCGLHWEGNLQVITKTENIRKSNRFDVSIAA